jgi:hypothetical protein
VDAPAERLARAENVGSNICVSVCCVMWGRTFVDSWLVFSAPLEVRRSARKGVQLFWPTVSSWARGKGTLYIRVAGGHLCSLLTRPLGFFIEINVSLSSVLVSAPRFSSCLVVSRLALSCPCPAPISERSAVSSCVRTNDLLFLPPSPVLALVLDHEPSPGFTEYHSSCPAVTLAVNEDTGNCLLEIPDALKIHPWFATDKLKAFNSRDGTYPAPTDSKEAEEEEYEVEKVLEHDEEKRCIFG